MSRNLTLIYGCPWWIQRWVMPLHASYKCLQFLCRWNHLQKPRLVKYCRAHLTSLVSQVTVGVKEPHRFWLVALHELWKYQKEQSPDMRTPLQGPGPQDRTRLQDVTDEIIVRKIKNIKPMKQQNIRRKRSREWIVAPEEGFHVNKKGEIGKGTGERVIIKNNSFN